MVCRRLQSKGILTPIVKTTVSADQKATEIKHSLVSILIFGFSALPVIYGVRSGFVTLLPDSTIHILTGLIILNLWNEVHFYCIHRLMHLPVLMRHVHYIHHASAVPTIYSVYSFHWFEALLLSTVPITIVPFVAFCPLAIALYPLTSLFFNLCGHSNYRLSKPIKWWPKLSSNHLQHHYSFAERYGFVTTLLDQLLSKTNNNTKK